MQFQKLGGNMGITHWSNVGESVAPGQEPEIAPGVRGIAFDMFNGIYIPLVRATHEGNGDVSRFLDGLPRDRRVVFPSVLSDKLRGMLVRRGFVDAWDADGECVVMERLPKKAASGRT